MPLWHGSSSFCRLISLVKWNVVFCTWSTMFGKSLFLLLSFEQVIFVIALILFVVYQASCCNNCSYNCYLHRMKFGFLFKLAVTRQLELFLKPFEASDYILFPLYTHYMSKCHLNRCSYTPDLQECLYFLLNQPGCWTQTKWQSEKTALERGCWIGTMCMCAMHF